jgi:predicted ATPase/class 3 adenylate cyclase
MDVSIWLRDLGLEDYLQAFKTHHIDAEVLSQLTAEDLIALGITSIGHRRKLLAAIAALDHGRAPAAAERIAVAARPLEAERRQLTVLFCDLVGSTELAARLDPEDLREVMRAYQKACADVVRRFEGHLARLLGDGVLAYFGWPRAHEDDAERAVRAGLQLVKNIAGLEPDIGVRLQARVGVATGHVVVGDLISEGISDKDAVSGDTPNLAARLQALAAPGSVVISPATRRLVGRLFELADLGPQCLKGFAEPLSAFRVEGEGRAEGGRFEALHGGHLTPLVGREHELGMLLERWAWARDGDGQVVLLSGEPGIGKSRMLRTLRERLGDEPHTPLSHYCSPHHTNTALYPVIDLLERAAGLEREAPAEAQLARLEAVLGNASDGLDQVVPLVAALLGVPTGERYPALKLAPELQKRRTMQALVDQHAALAAQQPVLALYEDVHWIDPSTLEVLGMVIERVRELRVLVLITFRPEFQPPWTGHAHITMLTMSRLGRRQGADLVARVTGEKPLPAEVVEQIVSRTDGVPLFVEELTKAVLESGLLADAGDHYELAGPLPPLAIPTTLHDSLMARLDRRASVKEIAQIGAALGREFSHTLLAAVADLPEAELQSALEQLVTAELVFRRGAPPDTTYSFKHTLVQDTAYQSLLKSKRQHLHARIAEALEQGFPQTAEAHPELLAHHFTQAGLVETAVDYWYEAGRQAIARAAMAEAVARLRMGLELLQGRPEGPVRDRQDLDLQVSLGTALVAVKGYSAPETGAVYTRALELCKRMGDTGHLYPVLFGQWGFQLVRAELQQANELAAEFLDQAKQQKAAVPLVMARRVAGATAFFLGELASARVDLEQALDLYDPNQHETFAQDYTFNPRVVSLGYLSCALFALGFPEQALVRSTEADEEARDLAHPLAIAQALFFGCVLGQFQRDAGSVWEHARELISLSRNRGFPLYLAHGTIFCGWAVAELGKIPLGSAQLRQGLAMWQATGAEYMVPYFRAMLAEASRGLDHADESLTRTLAGIGKTRERWFEAELHRVRGKLLLALPDPVQFETEACFRQALAVARKQDARMWELRAAMSLAGLWRDQGRRDEAHDLLAPVYGWFTEGFDTADLKDAKALLDDLA